MKNFSSNIDGFMNFMMRKKNKKLKFLVMKFIQVAHSDSVISVF